MRQDKQDTHDPSWFPEETMKHEFAAPLNDILFFRRNGQNEQINTAYSIIYLRAAKPRFMNFSKKNSFNKLK
jgi:hypothetical protein